MTMHSPHIDQAALVTFEKMFHVMASQKSSKLAGSAAVRTVDPKTKIHNMARMGAIELVEVFGRNPDKVYADYAVDNRQFSKRRFTVTVPIDQEVDVNQLITDPSSEILQRLVEAQYRAMDRVLIQAAMGAVNVGAPNQAPTSVSATADGVLTIDATGTGMVYGTIQKVTENFINQNIALEDLRGACIALTGKEHTALMGEEKFINNDYLQGGPVGAGSVGRTGIYDIVMFAGSVNGGISVVNAMLPEASTRKNLVLAPDALLAFSELSAPRVERNTNKVNTMDLVVDLNINAMRTEGSRVQIITTTV